MRKSTGVIPVHAEVADFRSPAAFLPAATLKSTRGYTPRMSDESYLTIGELARRGNVATSLLRYYEKKGVLEPDARTDAGYRLYAPEALRHLLFVRKAQRYGFSLDEIRSIRGAGASDEDAREVRGIAERRLVEIERRVTELLVLRHELELFLDDVADEIESAAAPEVAVRYRRLIEQVCGHDGPQKGRDAAGTRSNALQRLLARIGCDLADREWDELLADLRGEHVHVWQEEDGAYCILYGTERSGVRRALERIASAEAECGAHMTPEVAPADEGVMFRARGENAFLFAQLFLALEAAEA